MGSSKETGLELAPIPSLEIAVGFFICGFYFLFKYVTESWSTVAKETQIRYGIFI
jgi:hypothetical protein